MFHYMFVSLYFIFRRRLVGACPASYNEEHTLKNYKQYILKRWFLGRELVCFNFRVDVMAFLTQPIAKL